MMAKGKLSIVAGVVLCAPFSMPAHAQAGPPQRSFEVAQAPPAKNEEEEKKKREQRQGPPPKGPPPKGPPPQKGPPPAPKGPPAKGPPAAGQPPHPGGPPPQRPPARQFQPPAGQPPAGTPPPGARPPAPPPPKGPPANVAPPPKGPPPAPKGPGFGTPPPPKGPPPGSTAPVPPKGLAPQPPAEGPRTRGPGGQRPFAGPQGQPPGQQPGQPPAAAFRPRPGQAPPQRLEDVQKGRRETREGSRLIIREPGNRTIIRQDNRVIIRHDDSERFRRLQNARTERRPNGMTETYYVRPDGMRIITVTDANGRLVRRYRRDRGGREFNIIDNRRYFRTGVAIGVGALALGVALNLRPPVVNIPRERYIVDYERASDEDLYDALIAPPVDRLERAYSLEEIRYSRELRERMRRIDLDTVNFEFGSSEVGPDQYPKLERLARAMLRVLERNPDEVFLIEGHTDAVGSDVDNLSLSDRRAEEVAAILSETFSVPPENLVTQGYGEQFLKVDTPGPERANRRVAVRRVTPLMSDRQ